MSDGEYTDLPGNVFLRRNLLVYVDVEGNICHADCEKVIVWENCDSISVHDLIQRMNRHECS